jgi:large subunit ribosomal protein L23
MSQSVSMERLTQVLVAPHVSEKSAVLADSANHHVFKVLPNASKQEIKDAVEKLLQVKVASVRTVNVRGKNKRFGRVMGKRSDWKKAYVRLEEGHDIDLTGME